MIMNLSEIIKSKFTANRGGSNCLIIRDLLARDLRKRIDDMINIDQTDEQLECIENTNTSSSKMRSSIIHPSHPKGV
jgi:hypothetical protein